MGDNYGDYSAAVGGGNGFTIFGENLIWLPPKGSNLNQKTPISLLNEVCNKRKLEPTYEGTQLSGPPEPPKFSCAVKLCDVVVTGLGRTKKLAKQVAARDLLLHLVNGGWEIYPGLRGPVAVEFVKNLIPDLDTKAAVVPLPEKKPKGVKVEGEAGEGGGNVCDSPINSLITFCQRHKWPEPEFLLTEERSVDGMNKLFVYVLKLGSLNFTGEGKSKKEARKRAAADMFNYVTQNESAVEETCFDPSVLQAIRDRAKLQFAAGGGKNAQMKRLTEALAQLPTLKKPDKGSKKKGPPAIEILDTLSKAAEFKATYLNVKEPTDKGESQCVVILYLKPKFMCYGLGSNPGAAQEMAAKAAIEGMKVVANQYTLERIEGIKEE